MSRSHSHSSDQDLSFAIRESLDRFLNLLSGVGADVQGPLIEEHEEHEPPIDEDLPSPCLPKASLIAPPLEDATSSIPSLMDTSEGKAFDVQSWIAEINKRTERDAEKVFEGDSRRGNPPKEKRLDWKEGTQIFSPTPWKHFVGPSR
jgi:hypothetical protein